MEATLEFVRILLHGYFPGNERSAFPKVRTCHSSHLGFKIKIESVHEEDARLPTFRVGHTKKLEPMCKVPTTSLNMFVCP